MNNKGKSNAIVIMVVIAVVVLAIWYLYSGGGGIIPGKGEITNGYYDKATGQCWPDKSHPVGGEYPIGNIGTTFYQCCLNQAGQQVDCNNPSDLMTFAIYQGSPGIFYVQHGVTIANTGNVDLTKAWIDSATWTPTHTTLTNAYSGMVGTSSSQAGTITKGNQRAFSSTTIDLQTIGGTPGNPTTYTLSLVSKASATGLPDASKTTPATITVEQEAIGFSVQINLGE